MVNARSVAIVSLVAAALLAPVLSPSAADAAPGKRQRLQQHLGLTDDQAQAMREVHARHAEARRGLGRALAEARTALHQLVLNGGDQAAIDAKAAEVQRLLGEGVQLRVKALQEIGPLLTPEQREKLAQMPMGRRGAHKHRHPGQPGRPAQPAR
ncbi:MAG: Spy/CpxP family protein refolding chaperone [Candidatus Rokuibacteriota bacterium]